MYMNQRRKYSCRGQCVRRLPVIALLICLVVLAGLSAPMSAQEAVPCKVDEAARAAAKKLGEGVPVESRMVIEGQGSFGNYKIFAAGENAKLFTAGLEYNRHSWGCLLKAQVNYAADFTPFVLLNEQDTSNYYGVSIGTQRANLPGIGFSPLGFLMLWRAGTTIQPFLSAKGGFLVFTQKAVSPNGSYEQISLRSETGVQIRLTPGIDLRLGIGDFHFSNAFIVPSNPGLDVMSYRGGVVIHLNRGKKRSR